MKVASFAFVIVFIAQPLAAFDPAQSLGKCAEYIDSLPSSAALGLEIDCPSQLLKVCGIQEDKMACFQKLRDAIVKQASAISVGLPEELAENDPSDNVQAQIYASMFNDMRETPFVFDCDERASELLQADLTMTRIGVKVDDACAYGSEILLWSSVREARRYFQKYKELK